MRVFTKENIAKLCAYLLFTGVVMFYFFGEYLNDVETHLSDKPEIRILFIGNDLLTYHDTHLILERLYISDTTNPYKLVTRMVSLDGEIVTESGIMEQESNRRTEGGSLEEHWYTNPKAQEYINYHQWHYVILQDCSYCANQLGAEQHFIKPLQAFTQLIQGRQMHPVVLVPWGADAKQQARISKKYHEVSTITKATPIYLGEYWQTVLKQYPRFRLYDPAPETSVHPSVQGAYLNALILYRAFSQRSTRNTTYVPRGVSAAEADYLKSVVDYGFNYEP